ncbi:MAG: hypothetical protein K2L82_04575 [Lachnospiraceae bacterium]|nr:hypothetical protein [Lachnospiraceae bacterium]
MKKLASIVLFMAAVFSLSACGENKAEERKTEDYFPTERISQLDIEETVASQPVEEQNESSETAVSEGERTGERNLIVYFSRVGNTEYPEGIDASTSASIVIDKDIYGTTEYVARMIQEDIGGDLYLIQTQEPYTADFDELRNVNHEEMEAGFLPSLKEINLDIGQYDTVFVGYPVWATDVPQAVLSFLDEYDLTGKTVIPFCTHDGYGAGGSYNTIREASHAAVSPDGLAIEAKDVPSAKSTVTEWLSAVGMTTQTGMETVNAETAITITIGDIVLDGVLYDTALAQEIRDKLPLTISMSGYGGREYYGGVDFYPENVSGGQKNFENGDITYCEAHHNMAIFYAQTDNPNLSVDVIPIGKVTSDLSVFDTLGGREEITFSLAE